MFFVSSATALNPILEERLAAAQQALQKGDLPQAISLYRSVLILDPEHLLANYWLGVLVLKAGWPSDALPFLQLAALKDPDFPDFHLDLGLAYEALGDLEGAAACFRKVRESSPGYSVAQLRLAEDFEKQNNFGAAIEACQRALLAFPKHTGLLRKAADLLARSQRWPEALKTWRNLLEVRPDCPATLHAFGLSCYQAADLDLARDAFQRATDLQPNLLGSLLHLALVWQKSGRSQNAVECFQRALAIDPANAETYKALGDVFQDLGRHTEALASWQRAVELRPEYADAWQNLGLGMERENRLNEALASHQRVVQLRPNDATSHRYLGMVWQDLGMLAAAEQSYREALRLDPNDAESHWQMFSALASQGQFLRAWEEHEWRWEMKDRATPRRSFSQPRWKGDDLAGRALLLYSEQGFGDSIQAVRYVPLVQARGGRVLLWCPPELVALFQTIPGVAEVFSTLGPESKFDYHLPLMSLPMAFGTTLETIPRQVPYLRAPPGNGLELSSEAKSRRLRVGLVWCGSRSQPNERRPVPLECLKPLLGISDIDFYSLQTGAAAVEAQHAEMAGKLIDLSGQLRDFATTAAAIEQLDLVITVDTSVAHLAGALGKAVWVLLSFTPDWRWMREREDSPWYPTMRLFRQALGSGWEPVVERVREALEQWKAQRLRSSAWKRSLAQGLACHQAGELTEAERLYHEVLESQPEQSEVLRLLGVLNRQQGKFSEAQSWLEKSLAVAPQNAQTHHDLGLVCFEMGRLEEAVRGYQKAIELRPNFAEAHYNLGNTYYALKRAQEAEAHYQQAVEQQPDLAQAHYNLGLLAQESGHAEKAIGYYRQATSLDPAHLDALLNLGLALKDAGRIDEAERCLQGVLKLDPAHVKARVNLAALLAVRAGQSTLQQDLEHAEKICQEALRTDPTLPEAWSNLGVIKQAKGEVEEAIASFERSLEFRPADAEARFNLGIGQLLAGRFEAGWQNYEARWQSTNPIFAPRGFPQPLWEGEDLAGATLLVHAEQGYGDTIQFVRYIPLLAQRGARVIFECQPVLKSLLAGVEGISEIIERGQPVPPSDFQIPLMSLPRQMKTTLQTIPQRVPYLRVPDVVRVEMASQSPANLRVGLVWAGSSYHGSDRLRSLHLSMLTPLWRRTRADFYSLQMGAPSGQLGEVEGAVSDLSPQLVDFAATASAIQRMDLVISVDTAVAHLAGALNKRIWVLLPFAPDWRWLLHRDDSPWYPTMRLFRQPRRGDWPSVIDQVAAALQRVSTKS
jgi:tetratricopeptide (TPR) repeat protein